MKGQAFFMSHVSVANLLVAMYKTSPTETPDAYLRCELRSIKPVGVCSFISPWVYVHHTHKRQLRNDFNVFALTVVYHTAKVNP